MTLDALKLNNSISVYRNAANSYLKMSDNAKKLGLKDEQTISKNESRYDLDGTLKEEHLPIGSPERTKKKEEAEEEKRSSERINPKKPMEIFSAKTFATRKKTRKRVFLVSNTKKTALQKILRIVSVKPAAKGGIRTIRTTLWSPASHRQICLLPQPKAR
jgi:hypothetical protein